MAAKSQTTVKSTILPSLNTDRSGLLQRKCECGNTAGLTGQCSECQSKRFTKQPGSASQPNSAPLLHDLIQTKLTVGAPGDKYEQEADRVADQVMRMPDPQPTVKAPIAQPTPPVSIQPLHSADLEPLQRQEMQEEDDEEEPAISTVQTKRFASPPIQPISPMSGDRLQRQKKWVPEAEDTEKKKTQEEDEAETVQAKEQAGQTPQVTPSLEARLQASQGKGQPLPDQTRSFMESRFGHDFSQVRVHTDTEAAQLNRGLSAQAFTHRQDVFFGAGKYNPSSPEGKRLLAHELTHVVQQTDLPANPTSLSKSTANQSLPKNCEEQINPEAQTADVIQREPNGILDTLSEGVATIVDYGSAGVSAIGEGVSTVVEAGSETVSDIASSAGETIVALIEEYAPGTLAFIRGLPNYISEQVSAGFDNFFGGITGRISSEGIAGAFESILMELAGNALQGIGGLVEGSCSAMGATANLLLDMATKLGGDAIQAIQEGTANIASFFNDLWTRYGAPAADALASFAGSIWEQIRQTVSQWWETLAPISELAGEAWNWLVDSYLEGKSLLDSFLDSLFQTVVEKWEAIKEEIRPFMGYVRVVAGVLVLISPMGPFVVIGSIAYGLYELGKVLWQSLGQPLVDEVRTQLAEEILPAILAKLEELKQQVAVAQAWFAALADQLGEQVGELLKAVGAVPYLRLLENAINELAQQLEEFAIQVKAVLEEIASDINQFLQSAYQFLQPVLEFLRQTLLIALIGPFAIIDDDVWNTVKQVAQMAQTIPCIREMAGLAQLPTILEFAEQFRTVLKSAWALIQNPEPIIQAIHDALAPMVEQVPGIAAAVISTLIYPDEEEHQQGVQRYLEPAIAHLQENWWEELKKMGWTLIWPWDEVGEKLPLMVQHGSEAIDAFFDLEIGQAIDKVFAMMQDVNAILGAVWGWFAIAAVLVGAVLGALGVEFSGGATIGAGAAAGWALAETVGLVLLGAMAGTELAIAYKAMFDIRFTNTTIQDDDEQQAANEEDYQHIANSTFSLSVLTALIILGAIAQKIASAIWSKVRPYAPEFRGVRDFLNRPRGSRARDSGVPGESGRPGTSFTPEELRARAQRARELSQNPENIREVSDPSLRDRYDAEIDLGDGHSYRRDRVTRQWCLFSPPPGKCGINLGDDVNAATDRTRGTVGIGELSVGENISVPYKGSRTRAEITEITDQFVRVRFRSRRSEGGDVIRSIRRDEFERMISDGEVIRWSLERQRLMSRRPRYRDGLVDEVWERSKRPDGRVYDPHTGEELFWDRGRNRWDQWHMGHRPGREYAKLVDAFVEGRITWDEFLNEYNTSTNYWAEHPRENLSHEHEL